MKKLFISITLFICVNVSAQTFTPEEALQKFSKYPQERIFVQFDKGDYLAGETMHFRAYIFSKFSLSLISTNLYFEYVDKDKKIIYKNSLPIDGGIAEGSLSIPKHLTEDVYYFRAYTSWMLNFDERSHYIRPINVYNPYSATKLVEQPADWVATIHPEGGTVLDNVTSKFAVRLYSLALPKNCTGYLFDNAAPSTKIADITFYNEEVGSFAFTPVYGKTYSIKITDDKQRAKVIALPAILQQGIALSVNRSAGNINYSITAKGITEPLKGYKIIAENQGELIYSALIKNTTTAINSAIPLDSLTKGIVHITVFDAMGNAVAERLCFIPPGTLYKIPQVQFIKRSLALKGLNEWIINTDTINTYTYTLKVSNDNVNDDPRNFLSTYWLGDRLLQPVKANGYFDPQNDIALDHLLMSEQWGKAGWNTFLTTPVPQLKYAPDNFLTYQGIALYNKKILPNKKIGIVIQVSDSAKEVLTVNTDNLGRFTLKNIEFRDSAKVFYRINNLEDFSKNIDIGFTRADDSKPYNDKLPVTLFTVTSRKAGDTIPQRIREYMAALDNSEKEDERYKKLEGVVVQAKAKDFTRELIKTLSTPIFSEPGEIVFDFINKYTDETGSGIIDWLEGKVPGLSNENGVAYMRAQPAGIYINEFAADYTQLSSYSVTDIALVKVLRNAYALGSSVPVIVVYTKTGSSFKSENANKIKNTVIKGYPKIEKFKMVDYADEKVSAAKNDTRNVLFWNTTWIPRVNKQAIKFYNSDISKKYRLVIIGFSKDGIPVYLNKEILP